VLTAGVALSTAVALLKIEAGYHFWTDVAAGALVGASIGTLVPLLHTRQ
jgi:membrane-associated phospholipid phosphatase